MKTALDVKKRAIQAIDRIEKVINGFNWECREHYGQWLAQTYFYIAHTTRNMALACSMFSQDERKLHYEFIDHIKEEKGHEMLALKDLKNMGLSISEFKEFPETSAIHQSMFYLIQRNNPISILGYALVLEGMAAERCDRAYDRILTAHGRKSGTLLNLHIQVDKEHSGESFNLLERCTDTHLKAIETAIIQCETFYIKMYQKITEYVSLDNDHCYRQAS